jgi:hypothetical protein
MHMHLSTDSWDSAGLSEVFCEDHAHSEAVQASLFVKPVDFTGFRPIEVCQCVASATRSESQSADYSTRRTIECCLLGLPILQLLEPCSFKFRSDNRNSSYCAATMPELRRPAYALYCAEGCYRECVA